MNFGSTCSYVQDVRVQDQFGLVFSDYPVVDCLSDNLVDRALLVGL